MAIKYITLSQLTKAVKGLVNKINAEVAVESSKIGTLSNLSTISKTDLVTAINEVASGGTGGGITVETDPTVPAWAKAANKPTYTASEVGAAAANHTHDTLQTTAGVDNTEYNLIGTATSNTNSAAVNIYQPTLLSFSKYDSNFARLKVGSTATPGELRVYTSASGASGYTDIKSAASSTNTRTITLPDATGTVALTTDIPDVKSWALAANKPSYTFSELTTTPTTLTGYGITDAYTKTEIDGLVSGVLHYKGTKATASALPSSGNTTGDVWHVTADGSEWAWDGSDWQELGTAVDLSGYVPTTTTVNGKALSSNISLTASDVSALPSDTTYVSSFNGSSGAITYTAPVTSVNGQTGAVSLTIPTIPTNVSTFTNDSGYITTETDPTVPAWAKASSKPSYTANEVGAMSTSHAANGITAQDISNWNAKPNTNTTYTLSMSGNRITLTPSSGAATYVDLPTYSGGVS